jgi:hypothetical protein
MDATDRKGLRRCRVNITSGACENLPSKYRYGATMQVGGDAKYVPYKASPKKLSPSRLAPFQASNAFYL